MIKHSFAVSFRQAIIITTTTTNRTEATEALDLELKRSEPNPIQRWRKWMWMMWWI